MHWLIYFGCPKSYLNQQILVQSNLQFQYTYLRNGITGIVKAIIEHILHICAHTYFTYTSTHTVFPIDRLDLFGKIGTREALKTVIVLDNWAISKETTRHGRSLILQVHEKIDCQPHLEEFDAFFRFFLLKWRETALFVDV